MTDCERTRESLLDEVLGGGAAEIEAHLAECLSCRDEALDTGRTADRVRRALAPWRAEAPRLEVPRRRRWVAPAAGLLMGLALAVAWLARPRTQMPAPPTAPEGLLLRVEEDGVRLARAAPPAAPAPGKVTVVPVEYRDLRIETGGSLRCAGTVRCGSVTVSAPGVRILGDRLVIADALAVPDGAVEIAARELYCRSIRGTLTAGTPREGEVLVVARGTTLRLSSARTCSGVEIEPGGTLVLEAGGELIVKGRLVNRGEIAWR